MMDNHFAIRAKNKAQKANQRGFSLKSPQSSNKRNSASLYFKYRRNQLASKFAQKNKELREVPDATPDYNIFFDLLKVTKVIDLEHEIVDSSDKGSTQQISESMGYDIQFVPSTSSSAGNAGMQVLSFEEGHHINNHTLNSNEADSTGQETIIIDDSLEEVALTGIRPLEDQNRLPITRIRLLHQPVHSNPIAHSSKKNLCDSTFTFLSPSMANSLNPSLIQEIRYLQEIRCIESFHTDKDFIVHPLKLVSYNILCQSSMDHTKLLYKHLPPYSPYFTWAERWRLLEQEFNQIDANIFCLQEAQDIHYAEQIAPYFKKRGLEGIYVRRTSIFPDGCAIFYDTTKFELLTWKPIRFNMGFDCMDKDNVAQIAVFRVIGTNSVICVANTHIYFNMKRGENKLAQIVRLLAEIHNMEERWKGRTFDDDSTSLSKRQSSKAVKSSVLTLVGTILCGDFNIEPWSPLYRFLIDGTIDLREFNDRFSLAFEVSDEKWTSKLMTKSSIMGEDSSFAQQSQQQGMPHHQLFGGLFHGYGYPPLQIPTDRIGVTRQCTLIEVSSSRAVSSSATNALREPGETPASTNSSIQKQPLIPNGKNQQDHHQLQHKHVLCSVYDHKTTDKKNEVSTYHKDVGCPDLILYSVVERGREPNSDTEIVCESCLQLVRRYPLPSLDHLSGLCGPLPNKMSGSDHLPLMAVFNVLCPK